MTRTVDGDLEDMAMARLSPDQISECVIWSRAHPESEVHDADRPRPTKQDNSKQINSINH